MDDIPGADDARIADEIAFPPAAVRLDRRLRADVRRGDGARKRPPDVVHPVRCTAPHALPVGMNASDMMQVRSSGPSGGCRDPSDPWLVALPGAADEEEARRRRLRRNSRGSKPPGAGSSATRVRFGYASSRLGGWDESLAPGEGDASAPASIGAIRGGHGTGPFAKPADSAPMDRCRCRLTPCYCRDPCPSAALST